MSIKMKEIIRDDEKREGTRKATSMSKTIKRMARRKNFMQKGRWAGPAGSKPHS